MAYNYNISPKTQGGSGAYGSVPGAIGIPPNLYSQVNDVKGAAPLAPQTAGFIGTELNGQVAPDVQSMLQDKAATLGVTSGAPGLGYGSFAGNNYLKNLGLTSQQLKQQGTQDYMNFLPTVGKTMTDPDLAYTIAQQNAIWKAAPNPSAAAAAMMAASRNGFSYAGGGGGGFPAISAGGSRSPAMPTGGWDPNASYGANPPIAYGPGGGPNAGYSSPGSSVGTGTALYGSANDDSSLNYYLNDYFNSLNPDYNLSGQDQGVNIGASDSGGSDYEEDYYQ